MRIAVLLSCGLHPVSGARVVPGTETQAIRLGASLGEAYGLHAGPHGQAVADALGQGLSTIEHIVADEDADPVPHLLARLAAATPDVVLAGRRSQGGDETGLVPYLLAKALSMTLVADIVSLEAGEAPGTLRVEQSLGRGALRRLVVRGPAVLTVHPDAPAPRPFAFGQARRGRIETLAVTPVPADLATRERLEERPYRKRPKILKSAGGAGSAGGKVLIDPEPEAAAREILAYLRQIGVLAPAPSRQGDVPL